MSSEHKKIVKETLDIYRKRGTFDAAELDEVVRVLEDHGVWSMRQMEKIAGVKPREIHSRTSKAERTGGRFNPDTLELALEEILIAELGESNALLTARIWDMGTSPSFLARLIGQPVSTVQWRAAKGRAEAGGGGD